MQCLTTIWCYVAERGDASHVDHVIGSKNAHGILDIFRVAPQGRGKRQRQTTFLLCHSRLGRQIRRIAPESHAAMPDGAEKLASSFESGRIPLFDDHDA